MATQVIKKDRRKEARRRLTVFKNQPPKLTLPEEVGNAVTHGIGTLLAIAGFVLLLDKSDTGLKTMASCVYGISLIVMMLMSCLYHAFKSGSTVKMIWRRFDYSSIYLLIGGTFAPLLLVYYGNTMGIIIFCVQWVIILGGIILVCSFGPGKWPAMNFTLYFAIGWTGLVFLPDFYHNNKPLLWFILIGGIIYTVGMIPFSKQNKFSHFIWHFFVLFGAILHWFGIYWFVY